MSPLSESCPCFADCCRYVGLCPSLCLHCLKAVLALLIAVVTSASVPPCVSTVWKLSLLCWLLSLRRPLSLLVSPLSESCPCFADCCLYVGLCLSLCLHCLKAVLALPIAVVTSASVPPCVSTVWNMSLLCWLLSLRRPLSLLAWLRLHCLKAVLALLIVVFTSASVPPCVSTVWKLSLLCWLLSLRRPLSLLVSPLSESCPCFADCCLYVGLCPSLCLHCLKAVFALLIVVFTSASVPPCDSTVWKLSLLCWLLFLRRPLSLLVSPLSENSLLCWLLSLRRPLSFLVYPLSESCPCFADCCLYVGLCPSLWLHCGSVCKLSLLCWLLSLRRPLSLLVSPLSENCPCFADCCLYVGLCPSLIVYPLSESCPCFADCCLYVGHCPSLCLHCLKAVLALLIAVFTSASVPPCVSTVWKLSLLCWLLSLRRPLSLLVSPLSESCPCFADCCLYVGLCPSLCIHCLKAVLALLIAVFTSASVPPCVSTVWKLSLLCRLLSLRRPRSLLVSPLSESCPCFADCCLYVGLCPSLCIHCLKAVLALPIAVFTSASVPPCVSTVWKLSLLCRLLSLRRPLSLLVSPLSESCPCFADCCRYVGLCPSLCLHCLKAVLALLIAVFTSASVPPCVSTVWKLSLLCWLLSLRRPLSLFVSSLSESCPWFADCCLYVGLCPSLCLHCLKAVLALLIAVFTSASVPPCVSTVWRLSLLCWLLTLRRPLSLLVSPLSESCPCFADCCLYVGLCPSLCLHCLKAILALLIAVFTSASVPPCVSTVWKLSLLCRLLSLRRPLSLLVSPLSESCPCFADCCRYVGLCPSLRLHCLKAVLALQIAVFTSASVPPCVSTVWKLSLLCWLLSLRRPLSLLVSPLSESCPCFADCCLYVGLGPSLCLHCLKAVRALLIVVFTSASVPPCVSTAWQLSLLCWLLSLRRPLYLLVYPLPESCPCFADCCLYVSLCPSLCIHCLKAVLALLIAVFTSASVPPCVSTV